MVDNLPAFISQVVDSWYLGWIPVLCVFVSLCCLVHCEINSLAPWKINSLRASDACIHKWKINSLNAASNASISESSWLLVVTWYQLATYHIDLSVSPLGTKFNYHFLKKKKWIMHFKILFAKCLPFCFSFGQSTSISLFLIGYFWFRFELSENSERLLLFTQF